MPGKKSLILWIILIVLLISGFIVYFVSRNGAEIPKTETATQTTETIETQEENLTNIEPSERDSQIQENLNLATSRALGWRSDAALVYVQYKITSLTPGEGMETYVYDAPSLPNYHFTFTVSQKSQNFIRAVIPTEDYLGSGLLAIDFKYWKLNYVSALQIAEEEGGKDFREKNLDWSVELNLKRGEPNNWLYWTVEYKTPVGETFSVKINPYSGEVVS